MIYMQLLCMMSPATLLQSFCLQHAQVKSVLLLRKILRMQPSLTALLIQISYQWLRQEHGVNTQSISKEICRVSSSSLLLMRYLQP